jgi:hypothetical protein
MAYPCLPPGDEAEFFFPEDEAERFPDLKQLEQHGIQVRVNGSMRDVAGTSYDVSEQRRAPALAEPEALVSSSESWTGSSTRRKNGGAAWGRPPSDD